MRTNANAIRNMPKPTKGKAINSNGKASNGQVKITNLVKNLVIDFGKLTHFLGFAALRFTRWARGLVLMILSIALTLTNRHCFYLICDDWYTAIGRK